MIRYYTAGESHGQALVGIIEGIPAGLSISSDYINHQLWRRQQGYGRGGRMRIETDKVEILSGVRFGKTLGSPIALMVRNKDWQNWTERMSAEGSGKGIEKITLPRPGHADYVGSVKYNFDDIRNVIDRASARETAMRVACCSIAKRFLEEFGIYVGSHVLSIGAVELTSRNAVNKLVEKFSDRISKLSDLADASEVRILDRTTETKAISAIKSCKKKGDTLGGIFEVLVSGLPIGLGSYVHYDRKLDGQLAQAVMSIHAVKGVEIGDGFENAYRFGSEVHDEIISKNGRITRPTNRAGGLEGGVTNGELLVIRGAMKPISTLANPLRTVDIVSKKTTLSRYERSDVCAVPACSVIGESVVSPVIANAFLEKYGGDSIIEIKKRYKIRRV
ncbi:MAG: chorismate synthase, partial [Bacteroidota bacterium]